MQTITGENMGIITCSENCKYQQDGYCDLKNASKITNTDKNCPYFITKSIKKIESGIDVMRSYIEE